MGCSRLVICLATAVAHNLPRAVCVCVCVGDWKARCGNCWHCFLALHWWQRGPSKANVAFDAASASSTYSAGNLAGSPAFALQQALSSGSGNWHKASMHLGSAAVCDDCVCHVKVLQERGAEKRCGSGRIARPALQRRMAFALVLPFLSGLRAQPRSLELFAMTGGLESGICSWRG